MTRHHKHLLLLLLDALVVPIALIVTLPLLRDQVSGDFSSWVSLAASMCVAALVISSALGLPRIKLNAYEQIGIMRSAVFAVFVSFAGWGFAKLALLGSLPASVFVVLAMVLTILSVSGRFAARSLLQQVYNSGRSLNRILIYGAGQTGVQLAFSLRADYDCEAVAFVDDNPTLQNLFVAGLRVYAPVELERIIREKDVDQVVIATSSLARPKQTRLVLRLQQLGCEVRQLPNFANLLGEGDLASRMQRIDPGDYLNRPYHTFDREMIDQSYRGRNVMITGAGGSIGSELARQIVGTRPRRLVLFDVSEASLYQIDRELADLEAERIHGSDGAPVEIIPVLGSILDSDRVCNVLEKYGIDDLFHAAAYKHVHMVEVNPVVGLKNNVLGTKVLAEAARAAEIERFVLVSTDKAVRPKNIMGASKRMAELIVQDVASRSDKTRFSMVRFGNVLGSSGSVIPLFEEQIARGGPVTVTHDDVTRYFMTVSEASHLVLLAGSFAVGGEVFVLEMGEPVSIRKLAQQMIENSGFTVRDGKNPNGDIEIKVTGLRPGEKMHEELLLGTDVTRTGHDKILRAREAKLSELEMASALRDVARGIEEDSVSVCRKALTRWVEGYGGDAAAEPKPIEGEQSL